MNTEQYMQLALDQARLAEQAGEVPVGAVLTLNDEVIATGFNQPISMNDPTAHAEVVCLRNAAKVLENYRLLDTTLYVTLEPCTMCLGAMIHARVEKLVFGAYDPKSGAICSAIPLADNPNYNHQLPWQGGVREAECKALLQAFFRARR